MLIYLPSELLCLFSGLRYPTPHLLYMFPVVLFITSGGWVKVIGLLYFVALAYAMIELLIMKLIWYLYSALPLSLCFGSCLSENISNYTFYLFSLESQSMGETPSSTFPLSSRLITIAFENFKYPQDVQISMFLLLCFLNVFRVLFKVKTTI